jgi:biofilm PGA synthesis protein PgaD
MSLLIRTQQHWLPRTIDTLLTLIAWVGFISLIIIGVRDLYTGTSNRTFMQLLFEVRPTLDTLIVYVICGLVIGGILLIWAKYNEVRAGRYARRKETVQVDTVGLASSFRVSAAVIEFLRSEQVWILHNHEHGDLAAIEVPGFGMKVLANADYTRVQLAFSEDPGRLLNLFA